MEGTVCLYPSSYIHLPSPIFATLFMSAYLYELYAQLGILYERNKSLLYSYILHM